ncbi:unnamed protein product, partial [Allacma fusca]
MPVLKTWPTKPIDITVVMLATEPRFAEKDLIKPVQRILRLLQFCGLCWNTLLHLSRHQFLFKLHNTSDTIVYGAVWLISAVISAWFKLHGLFSNKKTIEFWKANCRMLEEFCENSDFPRIKKALFNDLEAGNTR